MANKSDRRRKARAQKRSAKEQRMAEHGEGKSKYALKHKLQARGKFYPTSPFYLSPEEQERIEVEQEARETRINHGLDNQHIAED